MLLTERDLNKVILKAVSLFEHHLDIDSVSLFESEGAITSHERLLANMDM